MNKAERGVPEGLVFKAHRLCVSLNSRIRVSLNKVHRLCVSLNGLRVIKQKKKVYLRALGRPRRGRDSRRWAARSPQQTRRWASLYGAVLADYGAPLGCTCGLWGAPGEAAAVGEEGA